MNIQELITEVREDLADENNDSIWTDVQYLRLANESLRRINGTHFSFLRKLVNIQPNLIVGETKKYTLPTGFQPNNHALFLDNKQMERLDENDVNNRRIDNVRFNSSYWLYRNNNNWEIEIREETNNDLMLLYYKDFDIMTLTPTVSNLEFGELEFAIKEYLKYKFWLKREFNDLAMFHKGEFDRETNKLVYYKDRIWQRYKRDYTTIMSDYSNRNSIKCGNYSIYSLDGVLLLENI